MNSILKHSVLILLIISSLSASAEERYFTRLIEQGTMVFFNPTKVPSLSKGNSLEYDITLLSQSDTVSINMTLTANESRIKSVSLHAGDATFNTISPVIYYSDMNGKKFDTRIHLECPKNIFAQLFNQQDPLEIKVELVDGAHLSFVYKEKVWNKETHIISNVLSLYK